MYKGNMFRGRCLEKPCVRQLHAHARPRARSTGFSRRERSLSTVYTISLTGSKARCQAQKTWAHNPEHNKLALYGGVHRLCGQECQRNEKRSRLQCRNQKKYLRLYGLRSQRISRRHSARHDKAYGCGQDFLVSRRFEPLCRAFSLPRFPGQQSVFRRCRL